MGYHSFSHQKKSVLHLQCQQSFGDARHDRFVWRLPSCGARPSTVSLYRVSFPYAKLGVGWLRWYDRSKLWNIQPQEHQTFALQEFEVTYRTFESNGQDEVKVPHLSALAAKGLSLDIVFP